MIESGQIVLFRFPYADLSGGKLRPALVVRRVPGNHDDWLICMISSQLHQSLAGFDEIFRSTDLDFKKSGLKVDSVVRVARLAIVEQGILLGAIGSLSPERMSRITEAMSYWIQGR